MMCADVPELMSLHELPASWSLPIRGTACKMTELPQSDPEFIEVEHNARKTSHSLKKISSVSETASVHCFCINKCI